MKLINKIKCKTEQLNRRGKTLYKSKFCIIKTKTGTICSNNKDLTMPLYAEANWSPNLSTKTDDIT